MAMRPAVGGEMPKQACAISERPEPTSPAMPTISPARKREGDVRESAVSSQSLDAQNLPAGRSLRAPGEHAVERAADHHAHDLRPRQFSGGPRRDMPPVAQHGDGVGDERQLLQPVRDEHDRGAVVAQVAHDAEQLLGLRRGQRGGRFVEDQELQVGDQRPGDLDELQLGDGKLGDQRMRIDGDADARSESRARATTALRSTAPSAVTGVVPMLMFSATSRCGNSFGSW